MPHRNLVLMDGVMVGDAITTVRAKSHNKARTDRSDSFIDKILGPKEQYGPPVYLADPLELKSTKQHRYARWMFQDAIIGNHTAKWMREYDRQHALKRMYEWGIPEGAIPPTQPGTNILPAPKIIESLTHDKSTDEAIINYLKQRKRREKI